MTVAVSKTIDNALDVGRKIPADAIEVGGVDTAQLSDDSVTGAKILDATVDTADLAALAVTVAKLGPLAVTTAKIDAGAVTGAKLGVAGNSSGSFTGNNGAGACTLTGALIGERVFMIARFDAVSDDNGGMDDFESVITVDDQIQQSDGADLSAATFMIMLLPAAA